MARKDGKDRGLQFKKGSWWVRLVHHGREKRYKCDSKSQAKALYQRLQADIREGKYFPEKFTAKKEVTLRAWVQRCLANSTNRNLVNERRYGRRWSFYLGARLLTDISGEDIRTIKSRMSAKMKLDRKTKQPRRMWSDATINRHLSYLKHLLMLALRDGLLSRNPAVGVTLSPEVTKTRFFSADELARLRGVMAEADWSKVALAVETGMRREELFQLRWDQVDLESGLLVLPLPKGGKTRYVPLSELAKQILRSFESLLTSPWVFPGVHDPMIPMDSRAFMRRAFEPALRRTGITGVSWHTLRHTAASRRVAAGVNIVSVKEILGHRSIQTTLRYAHLSPDHLQEAIEKGSLIATGTRTGTSQERVPQRERQPIDYMVRPVGIEPTTLSLEG